VAKVAVGGDPNMLSVWVDTAFTGELVLPRDAIDHLGLARSSSVIADLADGTEAVLDTYSCVIEWFGIERVVEVVESDAKLPLLGVGLLRDHCLRIDYRNGHVTLE
jgi:clan AA aspartic protease